MTELVSGQGRPCGGSVARAIQVITLSLIVTLFAAFAAHHAESIFGAHASASAQHVEIAMGSGAAPDAAPPTVAIASSNGPDVLQLIGLGCAALLLCGVLGALIKSAALTTRAVRISNGLTARLIVVVAQAASRIPPAPSPVQLSINRT